MVARDLLRLAWEADHDGRPKLRDSLLTLAVAESDPAVDAWAERCRVKLVAERPDHFLAQFPDVRRALEDPRVVVARDRLRLKFPEARIQSLLLRAVASRGPYLGRVESLEAMLEDLGGTLPLAEAENVRRDAPQPSRGPISMTRSARPSPAWSLSFPPMSSGPDPGDDRADDRIPEPDDVEVGSASEDDPEGQAAFYLAVLLAIAVLLASNRPGRS